MRGAFYVVISRRSIFPLPRAVCFVWCVVTVATSTYPLFLLGPDPDCKVLIATFSSRSYLWGCWRRLRLSWHSYGRKASSKYEIWNVKDEIGNFFASPLFVSPQNEFVSSLFMSHLKLLRYARQCKFKIGSFAGHPNPTKYAKIQGGIVYETRKMKDDIGNLYTQSPFISSLFVSPRNQFCSPQNEFVSSLFVSPVKLICFAWWRKFKIGSFVGHPTPTKYAKIQDGHVFETGRMKDEIGNLYTQSPFISSLFVSPRNQFGSPQNEFVSSLFPSPLQLPRFAQRRKFKIGSFFEAGPLKFGIFFIRSIIPLSGGLWRVSLFVSFTTSTFPLFFASLPTDQEMFLASWPAPLFCEGSDVYCNCSGKPTEEEKTKKHFVCK